MHNKNIKHLNCPLCQSPLPPGSEHLDRITEYENNLLKIDDSQKSEEKVMSLEILCRNLQDKLDNSKKNYEESYKKGKSDAQLDARKEFEEWKNSYKTFIQPSLKEKLKASIRSEFEEKQNEKIDTAVQEALKPHQLKELKAASIQKDQEEQISEKDKTITSLTRVIQELNGELQAKKQIKDIGNDFEEDIEGFLKQLFPNDEITRTLPGEEGADIDWKIMHNGNFVQRVMIETKFTKSWKNDWIEKLWGDMQKQAGCEFGVIITKTTPKNFDGINYEFGKHISVVANSRTNIKIMFETMRNHLVKSYKESITQDDNSSELKVYNRLISSESKKKCRNLFHHISKSLLLYNEKVKFDGRWNAKWRDNNYEVVTSAIDFVTYLESSDDSVRLLEGKEKNLLDSYE